VVGSGGEAGEGSVPPAPAYGDERDLVQAFTDLHRQARFTPAARPVSPMRARNRPASEVLDAQAVETQAVETQAVETQAVETAVVPDRVVDPPDGQQPPRPDVLPHRPTARPPSRAHHDVPARPRVPDAAGDVRRRGWAGTAERRLSDVLALAGASGALIVPWLWLMGVATLCPLSSGSPPCPGGCPGVSPGCCARVRWRGSP
jgi:hypothetical protein